MPLPEQRLVSLYRPQVLYDLVLNDGLLVTSPVWPTAPWHRGHRDVEQICLLEQSSDRLEHGAGCLEHLLTYLSMLSWSFFTFSLICDSRSMPAGILGKQTLACPTSPKPPWGSRGGTPTPPDISTVKNKFISRSASAFVFSGRNR